MPHRHLVVLVAVGLVVALGAVPAGCATTGPGGQATRAAANVILPPGEEEQLGQQFSNKVDNELAIHPDDEVQQYVQELGTRAVAAAGDEAPEAIDFEFAVVDAPDTVNAFAGPGGQIYVYTGLLREAENTAEVQSVLCHEVAHVTERHIAERMVAIYGLDALRRAALGDNPGLLSKLVSTVATRGYLLKYSRDHETQADTVGVEFMLDTGYDPYGFVGFFETLAAQSGPPPPEFLSTHPSPKNRIEHIRDMLDGRTNLPDKTGREEHQVLLDQLDAPDTQ